MTEIVKISGSQRAWCSASDLYLRGSWFASWLGQLLYPDTVLALLCFSKHRAGWYLKLGCVYFLFSYLVSYSASVTDIVILQPPKYLWVLTELLLSHNVCDNDRKYL
jgi:hypothetical protein